MNFIEIAIYIALNYSSHYKIPADVRELIPQRKKARGQRPGVTGSAAASESPTINGGQWRFFRTKFSDAEKKLLLAEAVSIGVRTVFQTHLYQFAGKTYVQKKGCPIGVRLSCAVARLVMNTWDKNLKTILDTNKLHMEEVFRYL